MDGRTDRCWTLVNSHTPLRVDHCMRSAEYGRTGTTRSSRGPHPTDRRSSEDVAARWNGQRSQKRWTCPAGSTMSRVARLLPSKNLTIPVWSDVWQSSEIWKKYGCGHFCSVFIYTIGKVQTDRQTDRQTELQCQQPRSRHIKTWTVHLTMCFYIYFYTLCSYQFHFITRLWSTEISNLCQGQILTKSYPGFESRYLE